MNNIQAIVMAGGAGERLHPLTRQQSKAAIPFGGKYRSLPPGKFLFEGNALDSMVSDGCIISGGKVWRSILSPGVVVEKGALVEESILFDDVNIEPNARIKRAIIDTNVRIQSSVSIGYDLDADARKGYTISEKGIVVLPKGLVI